MGQLIVPARRERPTKSVLSVVAMLLTLLLFAFGAAAYAGEVPTLGANETWSGKGTNGTDFSVNYAGGCDACYLNAYITWKGSGADLGIRVVSPSGEVREFNDRRASQKFEFAYWPPVLEKGTWHLEAFGSPGTRITMTVGIYDGT